MNQRLIAVCIAGPLALILAGVAFAVPLPYGSYSPGPTFDILAKNADEAEFVQIDGHPAYYDDGEIRFTTIQPSAFGERLSLATAFSRWASGDDAVVPYDIVHPPDTTQEQEKAEGAIQMNNSQEYAAAVAMAEIGVKVPQAVQIAGIEDDAAAKNKLLVGDVVKKVGNKVVAKAQDVIDAVQGHKGNGPVKLTIVRKKKTLLVQVKPKIVDGAPKLGVSIGVGYDFPFEVKLRVDEGVGGPSAGLMFSLAIYDTLTPGSLTDGEIVAGTGTISPDGSVGAIGGIEQKIAGAEDADAELFFVPEGNCEDITGLDPDLRLVKATTMHEARLALEKWAADRDADLPAC